MSKIAKASAPFSGPSFSPFPQNPNIPTGGVLVDGLSQKTAFPTEISIESLVPYTPRGRRSLEVPTPPLSTPRYTMANGLNFGTIACPSEAPVFGRRIKVPRGFLVASEPPEFVFVSEKQCKLPMSPSEAIFTSGKPIKPVRKSLLLAKEPEISFADASVSPEAVFVRAGYSRLDGGDEVIEELEDEVVGASSEDLESSLSLALKTPLPDGDEPHPEDASLALSLTINTPLPLNTEFDSERVPLTREIEKEPSLGTSDGKPLLEAPLDFGNIRSIDSTIPAKAIFVMRNGKPIRQLRQPRCRFSKEPEIAFANFSVSREVVFGGVGVGAEGFGDRLEGADEVIGELEGEASTLKPHAITSAITYEDHALLPDDDELCSEDASLALSPALNSLPLDTEPGSKRPLLILECESPLEAESDGKPLAEAHRGVGVAGFPNSAVSANGMFTAAGPIKQLCKHSALLAGEPEVSFADTPASLETIFRAAGTSGLEGADEEVINGLGDEVVESARAPGIITEGGTNKSSCVPTVSSDSSSEDLATSLSLALKTPLPDDDEPFSKDVLFTLPPALNTPLPFGTEFDAGDNNPPFEAPQDVVIARSPGSLVSTEAVFTATKRINPLCKGCAVLANKQEISPTTALVSWKVVYGGAGTGGCDGGDEFVDELEDRVTTFKTEIVSSSISSEDLARYLSITIKMPLPDGVETCSEDASLALSLSFNAPLPIDTRLGSERHLSTPEAAPPVGADDDSKSLLEALKGAASARSPDSEISGGVLAAGVGDGCLEDRQDVGPEGEQERPEEKHRHSQSQAIQEPNPAVEVTPIIPEATLCPKAPHLDNLQPYPQGVPLTHLLAVNTPFPVDTESDPESPLSVPKTESSLKVNEEEFLLGASQDIGTAGSSASAFSTKAMLAVGGSGEPLCQYRPPLSKEPGIAFGSASVSPELISGGASLALSLALNTPLPLEAEPDPERPLSNLEMGSPPESDDRDKPCPEALQDVAIAKSPDIAISMGELVHGAIDGFLDDKWGQEWNNIDAGKEWDRVGNTHPYDHSLPTKYLKPTLKGNTTTKYTSGLPSQKKRSAPKSEAYGHCRIFENPTIAPSANATTLGPLPSGAPMSRGVSSSTLSSEANTDIGTPEPDPTLVGFRETKFEFDLTDMFVEIFKEVGVVDLAFSTITPSTSAGTTRPWSQGLPADEAFHKSEVAASLVDARSEVFTAASKNKPAVRKVAAKLGKFSVRKSVIRLFNKFSPMPVDVVE